MKNVLMIMLAVSLTACGQFKGDKGDPGRDAAGVVLDDVETMVAAKNADRALTAQAPLTNGLSCTVQKVASGQCLNASSPGCSGLVVTMTGTSYTYLYKGLFNQVNSPGSASIDLLPESLRAIFQSTNFRILCSGQIVVTKSDHYNFSLNSDDGSILTINGSQVVNNDGNHGMTLRQGSVLLYRGIYGFKLEYAQTGSGNFGLELMSGGQSVDPKVYYH